MAKKQEHMTTHTHSDAVGKCDARMAGYDLSKRSKLEEKFRRFTSEVTVISPRLRAVCFFCVGWTISDILMDLFL